MTGYTLIISGVILLGASLYGLYKTKSATAYGNDELAPLLPNGRRMDLSAYAPIPSPVSVKPFLIAVTLALFGACLYAMYYIVNYSETAAGKFWLFMIVVGLFCFGCYFVSLVGKADDKHKLKSDLVIKENENRIQQKRLAVQHFYAEQAEAEKLALERKKVENEMLNEQTIGTDHRIIQSNTTEAVKAQIPVTAFTQIRTQDFATQVAIENLKKTNEVGRDDERKRAEDNNRIEKEKAHNVLNASERAEYNRLKSEFDQVLRTLTRELAELNAKPTLTPAEQSDVEHLRTVIEETKEDKNALRRNFLRSSDGEETPRLT